MKLNTIVKYIAGLTLACCAMTAIMPVSASADNKKQEAKNAKKEQATKLTEKDREMLLRMAAADQLSKLFREVVKQTAPAIVEIRCAREILVDANLEALRRKYNLPPNARIQPKPRRDKNGKIIPYKPKMQKRKVYGLGSGSIVDAKRGLIITNDHVVRDAVEVSVVVHDGRIFEAQWVRTDPATDLAIIKIKPDKLQEVKFGDSDEMELGDWVLAFGSPRGLTKTITAGIISAKGRSSRKAGFYADYIQTDAAINPGNSGGPLINMKGELIGVNNSIITQSGGNEGIGFSIPANMAKRIMEQLIKHGHVIRGYFGAKTQDIASKGLLKSLNLKDNKGALVTEVIKNTPAAKGGLKVGDFITRVGNDLIENRNDFRNVASMCKPNTVVPVYVVRDGKSIVLKLKAGKSKLKQKTIFPQTPPVDPHTYGIEFAKVDRKLARKYRVSKIVKGAIITKVLEHSPAAKQGLRPGMIITNADDKVITDSTMLARYLAEKSKADGVRLRVVTPSGISAFVFIRPIGK